MSRVRGFPEHGELVVCTVKNVKNFGAFVTLDEYDDKEGFVHVRDVATGWVKYIRDYIREGQKIVCKVLSLKSVNEHQKREKIQQWKNEKKAEKLVEIIAERMGISVDDAYDEFGNDLLETYETLYGAFEAVVADPEDFLSEFSGDWTDTFIEVAKENVVPPSVQIDGILEMTSSAPDGMELVKHALMAGLEAADGADVEITCVGCPKYRVVVNAAEYKEAEEVMRNVSAAAVNDLVSNGGTASLKRESK